MKVTDKMRDERMQHGDLILCKERLHKMVDGEMMNGSGKKTRLLSMMERVNILGWWMKGYERDTGAETTHNKVSLG